MFRFALSLSGHWQTAEDLAQECLLRATQKSQQLKDPSKTRSWLFRIVANLWKDEFKRKRVESMGDETDVLISQTRAADWVAMQQEQHQELLGLIDRLPETQRAVIFLSCVESVSHAEIAETLGMSAAAVKTNLSLARKRIRKQLVDRRERFPGQQPANCENEPV